MRETEIKVRYGQAGQGGAAGAGAPKHLGKKATDKANKKARTDAEARAASQREKSGEGEEEGHGRLSVGERSAMLTRAAGPPPLLPLGLGFNLNPKP